MNINPIQPTSFNGYSFVLKDLFRQDLLPTVKKGFYGDDLNKDNLSAEHLIPHSKGGPTVPWNLVLASRDKNSQRGNDAFMKWFNPKTAIEYLNQFIGLVVKYKKGGRLKVFKGDAYKKSIENTITKRLGCSLDIKV